jgi:hypothetical protein
LKLKVLLFALLGVLSTAAYGQWSEPVWLDTTLDYSFSVLPLLPGPGDSTWVFLSKDTADFQARLYATKVVGDSIVVREPVSSLESSFVFCFDGVVGPSGYPTVVYYVGDYPSLKRFDQPDWGVYTSTRCDTGWAQPETVFPVSGPFPFHASLALDPGGGLGLLTELNGGLEGSSGWLMFTRYDSEGWLPGKCVGPETPPNTSYGSVSLMTGDSVGFLAAFARPNASGTCSVEVWTMRDSLVERVAVFRGWSPALARVGSRKHLVFIGDDGLYAAEDDGAGWGQPVRIAPATDIEDEPALYVDPLGVVWTCWTDEPSGVDSLAHLLGSYNTGAGWSPPESIANSPYGIGPAISSNALGDIVLVWCQPTSSAHYGYRISRRLSRVEVAETPNDEVRTMSRQPTIVRGVLMWSATTPSLRARGELLDISGRKVLDLKPGANDVSRLAPGVYFVREEPSAASRQPSAVRKVVIQH